MSLKKVGLAAAGTAAAATVILGSAGLASAAPAAPAPSSAPGGHGEGRPEHPKGTPVTGDELAKVTAAVRAEDSAATVKSVHKDPDGSYDVLATKSGAGLRYEVSADLKTVTERQGGPRGGGRGRPAGTEVTGDELAKVTAAVRAEDSSVTVTSVHKDPRGNYHVAATKAGSRVRYEVSADLKTVTERSGGPRGDGPRGGGGGGPRPAPPGSTD